MQKILLHIATALVERLDWPLILDLIWAALSPQ